MTTELRHYAIVTSGYWAFTVTDGAIRMLVVLYFHLLGYSPLEVAMLFLFYEFFGIVTNLVGGWLGARIGLNKTMHIGMGLQIVALLMLTTSEVWLSVPYVMAAQALSGIAKDLNKMSAKASVKLLANSGDDSRLFKMVSALTGSKNALKGAGFFVGAGLLEWLGFRGALLCLAGLLSVVLTATMISLPAGVGKLSNKPKFSQVFSNTPAINWLAAARFFLFASRDVWFVVALPVFLYAELGFSFTAVGSVIAIWVIGYGVIQSLSPHLLGYSSAQSSPTGLAAFFWVTCLTGMPALIAIGLGLDWEKETVLLGGLFLFGVIFAINSAIHSYLILAYADHDRVSMEVGFYYMSNAAGRLLGTILSGFMYQSQGITGCLWMSSGLLVVAMAISFFLPRAQGQQVPSE
ncbi:organoarsenical effux MFS transporter ArsJ [Pseudomonadales bacterium]|nr:organoarsenical effux MFS transporter ArsJ [Pseudomonadales bacterium]